MARLFTSGYETGDARAEGCTINNLPPAATDFVRSGGFSMRSNGANVYQRFSFTGATARDYLAREEIFTPATWPTGAGLPTGGQEVLAFAATNVVSARLQDGVLGLYVGNTLIGSAITLALATWYRVELKLKVAVAAGADDTVELRVDGATVASSTATVGTTGPTSVTFGGGPIGTGTAGDFRVDDMALNDSTGGAQTTWCGEGRVLLLKPTADSARVGFTGGGAGTTNLWDAVNNTPPVGAASPGTNASQIGDATNNATDTYDASVQSYAAAGVQPPDTVTLVEPIANGGNSTVTSRTLAVSGVSNPVSAELTAASGVAAAAAFPTGWSTVKGTVVYAPAVTLGTAPVVRVRKGTASADNMMYDLLGLTVEFVSLPPGSIRSVRQAVNRSAVI